MIYDFRLKESDNESVCQAIYNLKFIICINDFITQRNKFAADPLDCNERTWFRHRLRPYE